MYGEGRIVGMIQIFKRLKSSRNVIENAAVSDKIEDKNGQGRCRRMRDYEKIFSDWKERRGCEAKAKTAGVEIATTDVVAWREAASDLSTLYEVSIKAKELQKILLEKIYGQEHAVRAFVSGYFQAKMLEITDTLRKKPAASFLFVGASGVGKTYLAETAAEVLQYPFARFDMSEYSDKDAVIEFSGADGVYKGSKAGNVTGFVKQHPRCVLIFDEIEKAHLNILHLFLQILDVGRLRDSYTDEEVSFEQAMIILTTNAGKSLYDDSNPYLADVAKRTIIQALRSEVDMAGHPIFPPALCSRFASGNVILFNRMDARYLQKILEHHLTQCAGNLSQRLGVQIQMDRNISTALILAEGGTADARMISGRAERFISDELFELFRQSVFENEDNQIQKLQNIQFKVDLDTAPVEIKELFQMRPNQQKLLVFGVDKDLLATGNTRLHEMGYEIFITENRAEAEQIVKEQELTAVLIEPGWGSASQSEEADLYLNREDRDSEAVVFYDFLQEEEPLLPVYLFETEATILSNEERYSLIEGGVREILTYRPGTFGSLLEKVCLRLHQQQSMKRLARYHQVLRYESAQRLTKNGSTAEIILKDFQLAYAVEGVDVDRILAKTERPDVTFDDIIGAEDAKKELHFFMHYMKQSHQYKRRGFHPPKGILLYGMPGTGKTLLAKAMAAEADMTFMSASGSQFLKKYVGEGPEAVHALFRTARKYAPTILFIDEIDAIGKNRQEDSENGSRSDILNALLTEMSGFDTTGDGQVFVLAATNFDVEGRDRYSLDPALIRRFDRKILVDLPNREERLQFLQQRREKSPMLQFSDEEAERIAAGSAGMTLSKIKLILGFSMRCAVQKGLLEVSDAILEEAFDTFDDGTHTAKFCSEAELVRIARHEAGHAFVCWKHEAVPTYLTVMGRRHFGGYMLHEDTYGAVQMTKKQIEDRIQEALAGRAAEIVFYGKEDGLSTGASGDLKIATKLAEKMLSQWGMDVTFGMAVLEDTAQACDETRQQMRERINTILQQGLEDTVRQIQSERGLVDRLAEILMKENHMDGQKIKLILGENEASGRC